MFTLLSSKNIALGDTETGRAWALKALHPADPTCDVRGLPDQSSIPSVFQAYTKTFNLTNATPGTAGIWSFDIYFMSHPLIIAAACVYDSAGSYSWSYVLNESFGSSGDSYATRKSAFMTQVEKYRLAYLSVTGHLDAAAVTNQGMIAVSQYPMSSLLCGQDASTAAPGYIQRGIEVFNELPKTYTQMLTLPNAYVENAKEGFYTPYRLSYTHQVWRNARDLHGLIPYGNAGSLTTGTSLSATIAAAAPSTTTVSGVFPYGLTGYFTGATQTDCMIHTRMDDGMIHVHAENLHYLSSMVMTYRHGLELQVSPGSPLVPFLKSSPGYDPMAIAAYFKISRELKDAYPEEYNSNNQLLSVLWDIAKAGLTAIPGGTRIGAAAEAIYDTFAKRRALKNKPKNMEQASMAAEEDYRQAIAQKGAASLKSGNGRRPKAQGRRKGLRFPRAQVASVSFKAPNAPTYPAPQPPLAPAAIVAAVEKAVRKLNIQRPKVPTLH